MRLGQLTLQTDVSPGAWAVGGVRDWHVVSCVVPAVFEAYARLFHPAHRDVETAEDAGPDADAYEKRRY